MECMLEPCGSGMAEADGGSGTDGTSSAGGSSRELACQSKSTPSTPSRAPRGAGDLSGGDMHLSVELVSDGTMKLMFRAIYCAIEVGFAALSAIMAVKFTHRLEGVRSGRPLLFVNASVAAAGATAVWGCFGIFVTRLAAVNRLGLKWSVRRARQVQAVLLETALMGAINAFNLAANIYALTRNCGYFDRMPIWAAYLRSVCWGSLLSMYVLRARWWNLWADRRGRPRGGRPDATLLDAPLWTNWPVAVAWGLYQGLCAAGHASLLDRLASDGHEFVLLCEEDATDCTGRGWAEPFPTAVHCVLWGLFGMYIYYIRRAFRQLHRKRYDQYRWTYLGLRYDLTTGGVCLFFGIASHCLLFAINRSSCFSLMAVVFGYIPPELVFNALTIVNSFWYMPAAPGGGAVRFSTGGSALEWTETGQSKRRLSPAPAGESGSEAGSPTAPRQSFCFETAVKAYYWCEVVYGHNVKTGVSGPGFSLDVAMGLYGLQHCEFVREKLGHACVAWNRDTVLVSFRGTHSATNVLTDLQVWRVPHLDPRGHLCLMTMPLVHKGFYQSWKALSKHIMPMILRIAALTDFDKPNMRVLLTGHSLGGAMAQLAAYDVRKLLGLREDQVSVYTLGCPRVGNHAFAQDYSKHVPDTWHLVNNIDAISRSPKLWFLYKHSGRKVVINGLGHMIVDPTFLEMKLTSAIRRSSMPDHLLANYRRSLSAVVEAQFIKNKGMPGGRHALAELLHSGLVTKALGVERRTVLRLESWGSRVWERRRERRAELLLMKARRAVERLWSPVAACVGRVRAAVRGAAMERSSVGLESVGATELSASTDEGSIEGIVVECGDGVCG